VIQTRIFHAHRYQESLLGALRRIDDTHNDASSKLLAYGGIYNDMIDDDRMCLCGMLVVDHATLPDSIEDRVRCFFETIEAWLAAVLLHGGAKMQLVFRGLPIDSLQLLAMTLQGAMLLTRLHGDLGQFRSPRRACPG
jgi:TetR/AcrR family transcriptional repressor of nem operon